MRQRATARNRLACWAVPLKGWEMSNDPSRRMLRVRERPGQVGRAGTLTRRPTCSSEMCPVCSTERPKFQERAQGKEIFLLRPASLRDDIDLVHL